MTFEQRRVSGSMYYGQELPQLPEQIKNAKRVQTLLYLPIHADTQPEQMWVRQESPNGKLFPVASANIQIHETELEETPEIAMERELISGLLEDTRSSHFQMTRFGRTLSDGKKRVYTFVSESDGSNFASPLHGDSVFPMKVGDLKDMSRDPHSPLDTEFREVLKRKMVRIGIVGTYSAGKTTLTNALNERIIGSVAVTEDVRRYVKHIFGKKGIQELTPEEFIQLEHILYREQTFSCRHADLAIIDSTPIGCPVYLSNYGLLAQNGHTFDPEVIHAWGQRVQATLQEYDMIVYLPPEIPYENDGFRTGPQFRSPLDEGFRAAIDGHPRVLEVRGYVPGNVYAGVLKRVEAVLNAALKTGLLTEDQIDYPPVL